MSRLLQSITVLSIFTVSSAFAATENVQVGALIQLMGKAQLFTLPSKTPHPGKSTTDGSMALFEGEYFIVKEAQVGDRVEQGNIVRTKVGSRVRIVYDNGDQIYVAPGTAYRIFWDAKTSKKPELNLMYGKVRGVVSKDGPRNRFTIRTKAATMGVRGTDFFIADGGLESETVVSVIRGSVQVTPNKAKAAPIAVKTGYSATVETEKTNVLKTTKEEFNGIQKASTIQVSAADELKKLDAETRKTVETLEKKAVETTAKDIKTHQPELYAQISPQLKQMTSVDELNTKSVEVLSKVAPSSPGKRKKPSRLELDSNDEDPYEKYFKMGN